MDFPLNEHQQKAIRALNRERDLALQMIEKEYAGKLSVLATSVGVPEGTPFSVFDDLSVIRSMS